MCNCTNNGSALGSLTICQVAPGSPAPCEVWPRFFGDSLLQCCEDGGGLPISQIRKFMRLTEGQWCM